MEDQSVNLETSALFVDGMQPSLPGGIFKRHVAEICSTLMAQAQHLDRMIDDANRARDQHGQRLSSGGPQDCRQESTLDKSKQAAVEPATTLVNAKELPGPSKMTRGTTKEVRDALGSHSQSVVTGAKEARAAMRNIAKSMHLVKMQAEAEEEEDWQEQGSKTHPGSHHLFADIDDMKDQIRHGILKPYSVSQYYYDTGICRRIADDSNFEILTLCVICVNAIWIAIDVDANGGKSNKEKHIFFQIVEWCFFTYFLGEICIRFGAFRSKLDCFKDFWFVFDSLLACLMVADALLPLVFEKGLGFNTSVIRLARLLKLARMARIARLLHKFPELNLLLRGIGIGARSVFSSFILLAVVVYLFSVTFRFLTIDTDVGDTYFRTVPSGMKYLVLTATMPDAQDMVNLLGDEQLINGLLFVMFISIATLTLLNMLIAILCEVIHSAALLEKETSKIQLVKDQLCRIMEKTGFSHHINDDMIITKPQFQKLLLNKSVVNVMRKVGVDAVGLLDFVEYIFSDDGDGSHSHGLTFEKLVELICSLGGSNDATVKDVVDMRQVVTRQLFTMEEGIESQLRSLQTSVSNMSLFYGPCREKLANDESYRMPAQILSPGDINAFLQMAVSTWVDCVKSQSSPIVKEEPTQGVDKNMHAPEFPGSSTLSMDNCTEEKNFNAEKFVRGRFEDANDSRIVDVLVLVKDLQVRLENCQHEIRSSKAQLSLFDCRAETIESRLRYTNQEVQALRGSAKAQPATLPQLLERELEVRKFAHAGSRSASR